MSLVIDKRADLQGQPGFHALIAGVSWYHHLPGGGGIAAPDSFGMQQLSAPALSAYMVYRWLLDHQHNLPVPLATCRLLLSPSPQELSGEPSLNGLGVPCTLENFRKAAADWRVDAGTHKDSMTCFYFGGHGVQRTTPNDSILLMEDFGDGVGGILDKAVDTHNIFYGMANSVKRPEMAETQLYFVDACRFLPPKFQHFVFMPTSNVFDPEVGRRDSRRAPIFYAAVPGSKAYAIKGQQTLFSKALLQCLSGTAGLPGDEDDQGLVQWYISIHSLIRSLRDYLAEYNHIYKADQEFTVGGFASDARICSLDRPPEVEVELAIDPVAALHCTKVEIRDYYDNLLRELQPPVDPHPYRYTLPAGTYRIRAIIDPPNPIYKDYSRLPQVMPPRFGWKARVTL